jgi:hypothetical protein
MSPSRILALVVPLLVAAFVAATLVPVADASGADEPVLGSPGHLAPEAKGWGKAHPKHVFNGGDPSGEVAKLEWRHWGEATATGRGVTWLLRPEGGLLRPARPDRAPRRGARRLRRRHRGVHPAGVPRGAPTRWPGRQALAPLGGRRRHLLSRRGYQCGLAGVSRRLLRKLLNHRWLRRALCARLETW